ncbi:MULTISPECIES: superoxide dismutase family protein [Novosphingobium]|uniref:superoxide dismutase family protein n=1 Tax=Novosphingobium TaxID=165696 RepID=UPI001F42DAA9|nr:MULTISPECIES: superoxide dismutase family protein [Novosphingobium]
MTLKTAGIWLLTLPMLQACAHAPRMPASVPIATAALKDASGAAIGEVKIMREGDQARLIVEAAGLSSGLHGLHFHEFGRCDGPSFASAGGHLNPAGRQHGMLNAAGPHVGDLPNLLAEPNGKATMNTQLAIAPSALVAALFDADGTAVVIHAGPDDYKTDPSGNSGGRIACGVLVAAS